MSERSGRAELVARLVELVQRMGVSAQHLGQAFATRQGLHPTDLEALLHVMHAEAHARPLTAGALADVLGVSSGAATGVIDRLERGGHLERRRDERDRRRVVLHHGAAGQAVAGEFFGPLGAVFTAVTDDYDADQLDTVADFLTRTIRAIEDHTGTQR